jgi:dTDP-4-amino-4,6-dideoxygalactose transaminase
MNLYFSAMNLPIGFNVPYLTGKETTYILDAVASKKLSGNGKYTQQCQAWLQQRYGFKKCLLTQSCTDALEMCALLIQIEAGDEVIMPSYTFVSTANAFILRGAVIRFADSEAKHPNMDVQKVAALINDKTKAIVAMHYAGCANHMHELKKLADAHNIYLIEDAAQAIDNYYTFPDGTQQALGTIGHFAAFSFHETKNIISGEGGMLAINEERFAQRAEIIWEKGTNRAAFWRGEIDKYGWVDIGSSYLPSEIVAAFLWAQLENMEDIQQTRKKHWNTYFEGLKPLSDLGYIALPNIPSYSGNNAHMFYIVCKSLDERSRLIEYLKSKQIHAVFHYQSLHKSPYFSSKHDGRTLEYSDLFSDCLLRLPMYYGLTDSDIQYIIQAIGAFYAQ